MLGSRAFRVDQPERYALELATAILGGQGGRLFMELREKRGLAYSVWSHSLAGLDGGQLVAGLATEPTRTDGALQCLHDELEKLVNTPPSYEEVQRNRNMLTGHAAMGLQRASERAAEASIGERLAVPWGFDKYCEALEGITPEQISAALGCALETGAVTVRVDPREV